jgi:precorrin-6A/cobalt-precorrin-6A reductase
MARRLLILGGTAEARTLAARAAERFGREVEIIVSLAGRTRMPAHGAGTLRLGGFGGAEGLAGYLKQHKIDLLVDATHPFAADMSANAIAAARSSGIALLRLERPSWARRRGDRWIDVRDAAAAARAAASLGRRIFLSFGGGELAAFAALRGAWFLVRRIDRPGRALPLRRYVLTLGRGPFSVGREVALLRRHRIDVVVTKASGGTGTRAKLDAARRLGLPVVVIERPHRQQASTVVSVEDALHRIAALLAAETAIDGSANVSA